METLADQTGLSVKEVGALRERFEKIAPKGCMSREQFKLTLGMLGMTPNDYIPNRMFSVFDSNGDGVLTFEEYVRAFAVLLRGSEEDRMTLSFHLADTSGTGLVTYADFKALVDACQSTTSALLERGDAIPESEIRELFDEIVLPGCESIDLDRYVEAVRNNAKFQSIIGLTGALRIGSRPASPAPAELGQVRADLLKLRAQILARPNADIIAAVDDLLSRYEPVTPTRRSRPPSPVTGKRASMSRPPSPPLAGNRPKGHRILGPKKGMAVHFGHENWNMVLSMMIGIRLAVGRASFEINRPLTGVDFFVKDKFSIVPQLSNCLDSKISSSVKVTRFIDYAPLVFRKLREEISGISEADYTRSVGPEQLLGNMVLGNLSSLAEQTTEGKGGAFFYYTADGRFMIKTVTKDEKHLLKGMLREYYEYLVRNKDSFIVRFYGLHGLRLKRDPLLFQQGKYRKDEKIFFVVMGNLFNTPLEVHRRFDLKGSWVGRTSGAGADPNTALKDNDFIARKESINVGSEGRKIICEQLRRDADFFAAHNVIDYSLLLGIHDKSLASEGASSGNEAGEARSFPSTDGTCVYYIGIIDILCQYNTKKRLENIFKSIRYDSKGISALPPQEYADRFYNFISNHLN
jgi:Ca2+-binding EF-hand superfamily protein